MPRFAAIPVTVLAVAVLLRVGSAIFIPLAFALLISQTLAPLVERLERRMPQPLAVLIVMITAGLLVAVAAVLLSEQVASLSAQASLFQDRLDAMLQSLQSVLTDTLGINPSKQVALLREWLNASVSTGGHLAMAAISSTISALGGAVLIGILVYLMLIYRRHLARQFVQFFTRERQATTEGVFVRIAGVGQHYLAGIALVVVIVGGLDTIGFLIIGLPFAVLFGVLGGLAVTVPYVGIAILAPLCAVFAYVATGAWTMGVGVLVVFSIVHFLEGNVITPYITGAKVDLNPLATILAVLIGGELWGVPGMILFIPLVGVVRVILEAFPNAAPIARLLGRVDPDSRRPARAKRRQRARPEPAGS